MAQITRFNGNVEPFAHESQGTERTIFGSETQSDTLDDNINTDFFRGWGIVGASQLPTKQDFNAFAYTSTALISYLHQMGVPEWNTLQEYFTNGITNRNGVLYKAVQANTGVDPETDGGTNWELATGGTPLTTKGDLLTRNGTEEIRLPVGSNTQILSANSGSPSGLLWIDQPTVDSQQLAKAWVNFDCDPVSIRDDYNVSSVTDLGTMNYRVNFSSSRPSANYAAIATFSNSTGTFDTNGVVAQLYGLSTSSFSLTGRQFSPSGIIDPFYACAAVFGD